MARDSSGTYTLPEAPFVATTVALSAKVNSQLQDLAAGLTDSLSRSGKGSMTVALPMGGNKITGLADGTTGQDAVSFAQYTLLSNALTAEGTARANGDTTLVNADTALNLRVDGSLPRNGSVAMTSNFSLGGFSVTNVAAVSEVGAAASLTLPGDGTVRLRAGSTERVFLSASGALTISGLDGNVLAGFNQNRGVSIYPPDGAGTGALHIGVPDSASTGAAMILNRKTLGNIVVFYAGGTPTAPTLIGSIVANGTSGTTYNTTSDYRLKTDMQPIGEALSRVLSLRALSFRFKSAPDVAVQGFLAHEAAMVVPEAVTGDKDAVDKKGSPVYQQMDASRLVPLLWAAVQELAERVERTETALRALQSK